MNEKAAELGDTDSMLCLGAMYECGEGVAKNLLKAMEWYKKALDNGEHGAQLLLDRKKFSRYK